MSENYLNEERIVSVNTNEKEDDTKALRPQSLSDLSLIHI